MRTSQEHSTPQPTPKQPSPAAQDMGQPAAMPVGTSPQKHHLQVSQALMSQDSIQHYVQDGEKETILERRRLDLQEQERIQFAQQIISQTSHRDEPAATEADKVANPSFIQPAKNGAKGRFGRQTDGSSRKERL